MIELILAQAARAADFPSGIVGVISAVVAYLAGAIAWAPRQNTRTSVIEERLNQGDEKLAHIETFGNRLTRIETMLERIEKNQDGRK